MLVAVAVGAGVGDCVAVGLSVADGGTEVGAAGAVTCAAVACTVGVEAGGGLPQAASAARAAARKAPTAAVKQSRRRPGLCRVNVIKARSILAARDARTR